MKPKKTTGNEYNEKIDKITLWKDTAKDEYILRRKEIDSADNKLLYMLLFNFTIFALFIQFIKIPDGLCGIVFYVLTLFLYFGSACLLILGLSPKEFDTINFSENEKNDLFDELRTLKVQYADARKKINKVIDSKLNWLKVSLVIFLIAILFTIIIKIIQQR